MASFATESNQGGGLHGRITVEPKQAFFEEVQGHLRAKGYVQEAQDLEYRKLLMLSGGTSFGGLSVLGMSKLKDQAAPFFKSPRELGDFIDREASAIFPNYDSFWKKLTRSPRQLTGGAFLSTKYSNAPLKGFVQEITGVDSHMSDIEDDVMITLTKMSPVIDAMFAKSHIARGEKTSLDDGSEAKRKDWLVWEVAMGSASPTTYLPGIELHNPHRLERIAVVDGGQSGWNDPSVPVSFETAFMYGRSSDQVSRCLVFDTEKKSGLYIPHDVIHLHWGTGDFKSGLTMDAALKNTLMSVKGAVATTAMQGVHRFSQLAGQSSLKNYFKFDIDMDSVAPDKMPDSDFTLSSKKQLSMLRDVGLYAVDQLSAQIEEAARLVADAYIERIEFEKHNPEMSYKEYLNSDVCEIS